MFTPVNPLWIDGFEHGAVGTTLGAYSSVTATPTIITSSFRTGARAGQISSSAASELLGLDVPAGNRTVVCSCYVMITSLTPGANHQLIVFTHANGNPQLWFNDTSNRFMLAINNTDQQDFGPNPIVINTWYRVDLIAVSSGGTTSITGRAYSDTGALTGALIGSQQVSSRAQTDADITRVSLGTAGATTSTQNYDDWVITLDATDFPFVPHGIYSLIPNADGTHNIAVAGDLDSFVGTAFDNSTTTAFSFIDHRPLQLANTADNVIRQDAQSATEYVELGFEDLAANVGAPHAVRAYVTSVMSSTTGTPTAEARLLTAGGTEVLTTGSTSILDTADGDPGTTLTLRKKMCIPPAGGWTWDTVNGLKARLGFNNIAADVNFTDLMLEVLCLPASLPYKHPQASVTAALRR